MRDLHQQAKNFYKIQSRQAKNYIMSKIISQAFFKKYFETPMIHSYHLSESLPFCRPRFPLSSHILSLSSPQKRGSRLYGSPFYGDSVWIPAFAGTTKREAFAEKKGRILLLFTADMRA